MTEYLFWWIARPGEGESEETMFFSTAQQARAYAAKLLRTETITQYGKGYWINPKFQNQIPRTAKIVDIITSKGLSATIVLYKNKLYVAKVRKDAKGIPHHIFYPMSANGEIGNKSFSSI